MNDIGPIWFWISFWGVIGLGYVVYRRVQTYKRQQRRIRRARRIQLLAELKRHSQK